jgi:hypothetical protein
MKVTLARDVALPDVGAFARNEYTPIFIPINSKFIPANPVMLIFALKLIIDPGVCGAILRDLVMVKAASLYVEETTIILSPFTAALIAEVRVVKIVVPFPLERFGSTRRSKANRLLIDVIKNSRITFFIIIDILIFQLKNLGDQLNHTRRNEIAIYSD